MNCPTCGAPLNLKPDSDYCRCDYCKGFYFPDQNEDGMRVFGEPSPLSCPVCETALVHAAMGGVRFLYCGECRGVLAPMAVFADFIVEMRAALGVRPGELRPPDARELDRRVFCPQCHLRMDTHRYGGPGNVIVDSCSTCGVLWLDHGELLRIIHAPDYSYQSE